ncbi:MAG: FkbM family methyltransferase [Bacteroidetes bacterium]|nr:FkbM family methyltransferase [Bacteroidota bacterium]
MNVLDQVWGKKGLQFIFQKLYAFALKGMNYGRAGDYMFNGEGPLIQSIRSMVSSRTCVLFDVGANKGEFTRKVMEEWLGMNYHLYVFEPAEKSFEILRQTVQSPGYVYFFKLGFGEAPGMMDLYTNEEGSGLASVYQRDLSHHNIDFSKRETIEVTTIDLFCEQNKIEHIDFLKLDVEGHELAVLRGAHKMLSAGRIQIVQFEFGGCNIDSRTFFRDYYNFFRKDFHLYRVLSNGLLPIDDYSEKLEVFQSANYLAVRKD